MEKQYKVTFNPALGLDDCGFFESEHETIQESEAALKSISDYTLFLHEQSLMPDYTNVGMVEKLIDGEWVEIESNTNDK